MIFLGVLTLLLGLGVIGYWGVTQPYLDPARVRQEAEYLSPAESWQKWAYFQQERLPGNYSEQTNAILKGRPFRESVLFGGVAGTVLGLGVLAGGYYLLQQAPKS